MRLAPAVAALTLAATAALSGGGVAAADTPSPFRTAKPAPADVPTLHYKEKRTAAAQTCDSDDSTSPRLLATSVKPNALGIGVSEEKSFVYTAVLSDPCGVGRAYFEMDRYGQDLANVFDLYFVEYDANGNEVWATTIFFDPTMGSSGNEVAGTWTSLVGSSDKYNNGGTAKGTTFYLQRWSRMSNNASPEPVKKGATITVSGALTRANWDDLRYHGYANQPVTLSFRTLTGSYTKVKTLTTSSTGTLKTTVRASQDGCFRFEFAGTTTTPAVKGTGDCVDVR